MASMGRDSVGELLIRRDNDSGSSSSSLPSTSRPSTAFGLQQKQDHVGFILSNIPPAPTDREAFGINSISHKKRVTNPITGASSSREAKEADRFYNGLAETRAQRRDTQGLMNLRYDSSAVASSLVTENTTTSQRNNRPTQTTFDIKDAIRTPSGLLLPEPSIHHKGHIVPAIDNLVGSVAGITPSVNVKERDDLAHPMSKSRLDRNRVMADQYGASVKEVFGIVSSTQDNHALSGSAALKPGRPVENHVMHHPHTHLYQGLGTAEALIRPSDFLPTPSATSLLHDHDNNDHSSDTTYRTTYRAEHTGATVGEPKSSPTKRRYYGGIHDHGRNDPYKKTQIY